jgi:putative transposase
MPQSLSLILVHLIFSTKNREPFITPAIEPELHPYIAKILRELSSPRLALNGTSDHIHVLFALNRVVTVAELVEEVKTNSSKLIKTKVREFRNFHWQRGGRSLLLVKSKSVKNLVVNRSGAFALESR